MATNAPKHLSRAARRALELLVDEQSTEAWMLAHGFTDRMLLRLVRAGLITVQYEVVKTDDRIIDVRRVTITDAGRQTLKGESAP